MGRDSFKEGDKVYWFEHLSLQTGYVTDSHLNFIGIVRGQEPLNVYYKYLYKTKADAGNAIVSVARNFDGLGE